MEQPSSTTNGHSFTCCEAPNTQKADTHLAKCPSDIWETDTCLPECPENSVSSTQVITHSAQGFSSLIIDPSAPAQLDCPC